MARPTLDEIFADEDPFGLLDVKPAAAPRASGDARNDAIIAEVRAFQQKYGRLPYPDADNHDEMRLGTIWGTLPASVTGQLEQQIAPPVKDWRAEPTAHDIPDSLDDIFDDDLLDVDASLFRLNHSTASASRQSPDHRADFVPCRDFHLFEQRFADIQAALESGQRKARPVKKGAIFEPIEGDVFIRNGLFALIAEKSEMTMRGGSRDHRLRVIFSNGTESDPLMSSFRKSLNDDKTARFIEKVGLGPLDPDWEADRLNLSGTIYVLRSLSEESVIKKDRMILHKIGVTSQDVRRRIADARNDPTFLLAPVEIVAEFALQNLPRNKVEHLLHRFFEDARPAGLFIQDRFGKTIHPKEWFYVLPHHVSQAAQLIKDGTLHLYRYDAMQQKIVKA
jgi:hypothetical protein